MANVSSTINKSLYRKIDENGNYSCVIDLENGTNTKLTTENKTIVGAINEINSKSANIPTILITGNISEDFTFNDTALETIYNNTIKGSGSHFRTQFIDGSLFNGKISTILFTLKSSFKNGVTGYIYLFDGYYTDSSKIYKIYLLFEISGKVLNPTNFTQKAIKIEEYASF